MFTPITLLHKRSVIVCYTGVYMIPKVDTFTQNIADEIRRKEASLSEIAKTEKNSSQVDTVILQKKKAPFLLVLIPLFAMCIILLAGVFYYFFPSKTTEIVVSTVPVTGVIAGNEKIIADLTKISPTLASAIGRFVTKVEYKDNGYILTIDSYSPVFAYMTRNENLYIEELATLFPATETSEKSTTTSPMRVFEKKEPLVATTTAVSTTTLGATTTKSSNTIPKKGKTSQKIASSTSAQVIEESTSTAISEVETTRSLTNLFRDVTLSSQNMRVWSDANHTVVYAFIADKKVIIANTPEKILILKGDILR